MKFTLEINMNNAAYDPAAGGNMGLELALHLQDIIEDLEDQPEVGYQYPVRDVNGDYVGFWHVTD